MKISRFFILFAAGAALFMSAPNASANQNMRLDAGVQKSLLAAKSVLGKAVDRQSFNGKPVLVTFFASW